MFVPMMMLASSVLSCSGDSVATTSGVGETTDATGDGGGDGTSGAVTDDTAVPTEGGETGVEPIVCGDGVVQPGEACDDGNDAPDDGCSNDCTLPVCGDGLIQAGEECDAGAKNAPNAACLLDCKVNVCGDGFVGPGEACDDGNEQDQDACGNDCAPGSCGNGSVDAEFGEQCDDANADDTDACLHTCVIASCGDGVVQAKDAEGLPLPPGQGEACDDGAKNSDSAACLGSCKLAECGDGLVHEGVEECDNGVGNGPAGACLANCHDNVCGDGLVGPTEACDDGNVSSGDGCSPTCELEGCGDGVAQPGEACDDGKNGNDDDGCTDQCKLEACGDGILQNGEQCDDGNLNANTGACTLLCSPAKCGDGWVWSNKEACDQGPANADDAACTSMCKLASCGDGLVGPGEGCDDGNQNPGDGCGSTCISEECGNGVVEPGEACDDGNAVDKDQCTNACTIPEPCNGPHVSRDTCVPGDQCGTVARPWCSISAALAGSVTSPIKVAGSGSSYGDHVVMKNGFDVLGGYEPTFTAPRNPDPATNATSVRFFGPVVEWNGGVTATLDGFKLLADIIEPLPSTHASVTISGSAGATLLGVRIEPFVPAKVYASKTYGILITGGTGGSTVIGPLSQVLAAKGTKSVGLGVVVDASPAAITIGGAILGNSGTQSFGVEHLGLGNLTITGGSVTAGAGTTSATGVLVGRTGYGTTQLTNATIHGGAAKTARGVDHRIAQALLVNGGLISGGGVADNATVVHGLLTEAVDQVSIKNTKVVGCDVAAGTTPATSRAIDLRNTAVAVLTGASIEGATVDGGTLAEELTGIRTQGVPLTVKASTVTATSGKFGNTNRGIHITGSFVPGTIVTLTENNAIDGGTAAGLGPLFFTNGVDVDAKHPVTISDNLKIAGAATPSRSPASGVRLVGAGPGHVIEGNQLITGGPDNAGFYDHSGVWMIESAALIEDNTLIAGNEDPAHVGDTVNGIYARASQIIVRNNAQILGGHAVGGLGEGSVFGIHVWAPNANDVSSAVIEDNTIIAGTAKIRAYGLAIEMRTHAIVQRNIVFVCPFHGDDPRCKTGQRTGALVTTGNIDSLYANNWFFGGYAGTRTCTFGCPHNAQNCFRLAEYYRFDGNLCHAPFGTAGYIEPQSNGANPPSLLINNIFHVETGTGPALSYEPPWADPFEIRHNDFVTGGKCVVNAIDVPVCAANIAEVNALNGNGIVIASDNVSVSPAYVAPAPKQQTVAGYHLDATCALKGLGEPSPQVPVDYDGDPRGDGNASYPEIGPDECK
jgi:cysteine-rich repeat protein